MENNGLSKFICKLVIVKELDLETQQQNHYERKGKRKSELSKLLSVKTRISDEPNFGLRVKYTPEIGFNLLKFIPL